MNDIEKEFIPYKQAFDLEELGFNEPCIAFFNTKFDESLCFVDLFGFHIEKTLEDFHINNDESKTSASTYSQAFRFFREKYNLFHNVDRVFGINNGDIMYVGIYYKGNPRGNSPKKTVVSKTSYEKAELECLKKINRNSKK